jgi:hypothetical protein
MRAWPAALCLIALAGCAGPPAPVDVTGTTAPDGTEPPVAPPPPVGAWGSKDYEQDFQSVPLNAYQATGALVYIQVPANATTVFFNVTVTPTVPDEFILRFRDPENLESGDAEPTAEAETAGGTASVEVEAPLEGEWRLAVLSKTAPNQAHIKVNVNAYVLR